MQLSKRILMSLAVLLLASGAQAGKPILGTVIESDHIYPWEMQRINASEWAESGDALAAFNSPTKIGSDCPARYFSRAMSSMSRSVVDNMK
jgi:hypothetical protein